MSSAHKLSVVFAPQQNLYLSREEADRRILIVDDDTVVSVTFASCLMERYSCTTAGSVGEALAVLARETFALVIASMSLPGRNGEELLREISERHPDTMLIMTSSVDQPLRARDTLLGADGYLVKPCDLDVVELTVARALERRSRLREAEQLKQALEERNLELARRNSQLEHLQAQMLNTRKMAAHGQFAAGIAPELTNTAGLIYRSLEFQKEYVAGLKELLNVYDNAKLSAPLAADIYAIKEKIGYAELLEILSANVNDCSEAAERMRDVVQSLRLFAGLDEAKFKKVDLHEGIESTIRQLTHYFSDVSIELHRDYCGLPQVGCYAGQLNQVWMNLLVNAIHAVGRDGHIRIATRLDNRNVSVTISDTGRGISPEHLDKIFDPFFTTKPAGEATGLGLSITSGIVERHNGSITVESCPGLGTTFTVMLPVNAG
jgi:two-component system NtrC family sensor kinase